jgi:hypothetical protein
VSPVPPPYFEPIRKAAEERWHRLENDPDIAGPWRLLFKQVQSPRHVLSELMQNADDVGAANAVVNIEGGSFSFMHDGTDFTELNFQSICRFGYSNKREMHTIGFRGIGFKSVFSLGDRVYLLNPTLSVYFDAARFTLPVWTDAVPRRPGWTEIRIEITDKLRRQEFEANIREWTQSGVSLLFFRKIRSFRVGNLGVQWQVKGPGPALRTEWMTRAGVEGRSVLHARSELVAFPPECLEEIRKERQVFESDSIETPPASMKIVPGAKGRLFVILPTGVETSLPFACNAPFVQDPARLKIKELEISPTNRWLLERIGQLAADVLLSWVSNIALPAERRTNAYLLLVQPPVQSDDSAIQISDRVERLVASTMARSLAGKPFLIDSEGVLVAPGLVYAVDPEIQEIWSAQQILALMGTTRGALLHPSVPKAGRDILIAQGHVQAIDRSQVFQWLKEQPVPRPVSWGKLARLWAYLAPELMSPVQKIDAKALAIVPTAGEWLVKAPGVVRPKPGVLLETDEAELLAKHMKLVDEEWITYLDPDAEAVNNEFDPVVIKSRLIAIDVYKRLGSIPQLTKQGIAAKLAALVPADPHYTLEQCVTLVRMAVETDAELPEDFPYFARNGKAQPARAMCFDPDGFLEEIMPEEWKNESLLHPRIVEFVDSASFRDWTNWLGSSKSALVRFPRPKELLPPVIKGREKIAAWLEEAGGDTTFPTHRSQEYRITDCGYDPVVLYHWNALPSQQMAKIFNSILEIHSDHLEEKLEAFVESLVRIGKWLKVTSADASWLRYFRKVPCLIDSHGVAAKPSELAWGSPGLSASPRVRRIHPSYEKAKYKNLLVALGVGGADLLPDPTTVGGVGKFASARGFQQDPVQTNRFVHPDGHVISNDGDSPFSWRQLDASGKTVLRFQFLDTSGILGIDISTEEWDQFQHATPELAYLVEHPISAEPQLIRFRDLESHLESGEWALESTGYRLIRKKFS